MRQRRKQTVSGQEQAGVWSTPQTHSAFGRRAGALLESFRGARVAQPEAVVPKKGRLRDEATEGGQCRGSRERRQARAVGTTLCLVLQLLGQRNVDVLFVCAPPGVDRSREGEQKDEDLAAAHRACVENVERAGSDVGASEKPSLRQSALHVPLRPRPDLHSSAVAS